MKTQVLSERKTSSSVVLRWFCFINQIFIHVALDINDKRYGKCFSSFLKVDLFNHPNDVQL